MVTADAVGHGRLERPVGASVPSFETSSEGRPRVDGRVRGREMATWRSPLLGIALVAAVTLLVVAVGWLLAMTTSLLAAEQGM